MSSVMRGGAERHGTAERTGCCRNLEAVAQVVVVQIARTNLDVVVGCKGTQECLCLPSGSAKSIRGGVSSVSCKCGAPPPGPLPSPRSCRRLITVQPWPPRSHLSSQLPKPGLAVMSQHCYVKRLKSLKLTAFVNTTQIPRLDCAKRTVKNAARTGPCLFRAEASGAITWLVLMEAGSHRLYLDRRHRGLSLQ